MKVLFTAVLLVTVTAYACCNRCDCDQSGTAGGHEQILTDGDTTDDADRQGSGRAEGTHRRYSGAAGDTTERSSGGVGNANAETGVNPNEASDGKNQHTTKEPAKPGVLGTRTTRPAGTGTSSGRSIN
jgi:hypothetical protein